ncbi:MAG TPA: amidohydrolase family protein [Streptosporangiaceae bacterium]
MTAFDLIIRGGQIADGTGAGPVPGDVGVTGTRIAAVGDLTGADARDHLDAAGAIVFPGFIDAHSHADASLPEPHVQAAYLHQGVTTVILGQDGVSFAPSDAFAAGYADRYFRAINGPAPARYRGGVTVAELLAAHDRRAAINAAYLVPAATVRAQVVGLAPGAPTADQLGRMVRIVEDALADGAAGLSTGLDYVPGQFADAAELAALCVPVARAGGVYVSHLRGYRRDRLAGAIGEAAVIAARSGAAGHVSHLHGPAAVVERALDDASRDLGVTLSHDSYPYLRGNTILAMHVLPAPIQAGGIDTTLARLGDPGVREELRRTWLPALGARLDTATLSFLGDPEFQWAEGMTLAQAAGAWGHGDVADFICAALIACDLAVGCVMDNGPERTEEDVRQLLRRPSHMASSDAIFLGRHPHPRGWGAFARLLGRHVRDLGDWSWGEAAYHLSGHAARRFGLAGRGTVAAGGAADLAVIDPAAITDVATYDDPARTAQGVRHVVVSGQVALRDGAVCGVSAGRALRPGDTSR